MLTQNLVLLGTLISENKRKSVKAVNSPQVNKET